MTESLDQQQQAAIDAAIAANRGLEGAMLPILHGVQDALGWVPPGAVPAIAQALNLSRAEVHGVLGFYHHFRQQPPARHVVQLCRAEACQAVGAGQLAPHVQQCLGAGFGARSVDGRFMLEAVYCLGNCARGPALTIDGRLHSDVTPAAFDALLSELPP
jgi:formate dehydrogenase subunit gamma